MLNVVVFLVSLGVRAIRAMCRRRADLVLENVGCLRCLLLVMCTHPVAKELLTLHLARSESHERHFGCN